MQTLSDILDEIEQARQIAIEQNKPSAMIQATMCKAKLLGLDKGEPEQLQETNFKISFVSPSGQVTSEALAEFREVAKEVLEKV
jgi:nicotinate-nucleotide pyrophosphorylase